MISQRTLPVAAISVAMILAAVAGTADGFNELGHSVIAKVAYDQLSPARRKAIHEILKQHPHYTEYLVAGKPSGVSDQEWSFMRAATWSDWVRGNHRLEYNQSAWHYINYPYRMGQTSQALPAPLEQPENIQERLPKAFKMVKNSGQTNSLRLLDTLSPAERRAVALTWMFHLIGDLHQPLHVVALVDDDRWPAASHGDQGGNLVAVVIAGAKPTRLHAFWDGALGLPMNQANLLAVVGSLATDPPFADGSELALLAQETRLKVWAEEGYRLAIQHAYLNGELHVSPWRDAYSGGADADADVPVLPPAVQDEARRVYRQRLLLGGQRLAFRIKTLIP